jgi:microcystin-dependent protein
MSLPQGLVVIWSGSTLDIPQGWFLCNGSNGTPDLRNRFVVGAGSSYALNASGGSKDAIVPSHGHSITAFNSGGNHSHSLGASWEGASPYQSVIGYDVFGRVSGAWSTVATTTTGASNNFNHSHSGGSVSTIGSSGTDKNLPPYYTLAYIMKGAN